jgi:tRNA1(Val) A37 N6-methylase TrmN6
MDKNQEMVVEEGQYNLIANTDKNFEVTHLVLKSSNGSKRVWRVKELSEKEANFVIEKFA